MVKIKIFLKENRMWMYLAQYILFSIVLAVGVILIDTKFIPGLDYIPDLLLTSVDLSKEILSTLAGSLLTITTFTFSTIMVVLSLYSSNFSPRVVNNFLTDKITMKVLGIFIGGFFYCIFTLFFMKKNYSEYLVISATIAVIYSALCIFYFVVFVYSVSSSIQATELISRLYDESYGAIEEALKQRENQTSLDQYEIEIFKCKLDISSNKSGYLAAIDFKKILKNLGDIESKLVIKVGIGDFISKKEVIATIYYFGDLKDEELKCIILDQLSIEEKRIAYNDYRFSLQKIVDITLRAISPGINDPNTAIHCINILGVLLSKLGEIKGRYTVINDDDSNSEILYENFYFKGDLCFTFLQIVHYGKQDISVMLAIFKALKTIKRSSSEEKGRIIEEFGDYVYHNSIDHFSHKFDIEMLKKAQETIS